MGFWGGSQLQRGALTLASPGSLPADTAWVLSQHPARLGWAGPIHSPRLLTRHWMWLLPSLAEAPGPCGALGLQSLWGLGLDLVWETDCLGCPWPSASWLPEQEGWTRVHLPSWIIHIYNFNRSYHSSKSDHDYITADNWGEFSRWVFPWFISLSCSVTCNQEDQNLSSPDSSFLFSSVLFLFILLFLNL